MKLVRYGVGRQREARHPRQQRQDPRPVQDREGHRRRGAVARRPRQDQEGQYRQAAEGRRQSAARPLRRAAVELHRHRLELRRSRRRSRHAASAGADHLQQGAVLHLRAERQHHHTEGLGQARLRGRARHRDRQTVQLSQEGAGDGRGRRLFPLQRRLRARVPDRARRPMDQGQGLRELRPDRPLGRHQGRDQGRRRISISGSRSTARPARRATPRP